MKVLFVDDNVESMAEAVASLKAAGMDVVTMTGFSEFSDHLKGDEPFDVVVLDWHLDGETSDQAKGCLSLLRESRFVPVVIYTEHKEQFEGDGSGVFPGSCVLLCGKSEFPTAELGKRVSEWDKSLLAGRISRAYRKASRSSIEKVLYDLASMDEGGIQSALTVMTKREGGDSPDVDHALELLHRMAGRHVGSDADVRSSVEAVLGARKDAAAGGRARIWSHHMYYVPGDNIVRAGDVVEWGDGTGPNRLGLILTPACDLAYFKTAMLRIIGISELEVTKEEQFYPLPHMPMGGKVFKNFFAHFHDVTTLRNKTILDKLQDMQKAGQKSPRLPKVHMRYDQAIIDSLGNVMKWRRIARVDDPYRSDIFQKFSSHASRIGTPEVPHG